MGSFHGRCFLRGALRPSAALGRCTADHTEPLPDQPTAAPYRDPPPLRGDSSRATPGSKRGCPRSEAAAGSRWLRRGSRRAARPPAPPQRGRCRRPARSRKRAASATVRPAAEVTAPGRPLGRGRGEKAVEITLLRGGGGGSGSDARSSPLLGVTRQAMLRRRFPASWRWG